VGLAGQRGLVHAQVGAVQQPAVRRDAVAFLQEDDISGHQVLRQDVGFLAVAHHARLGRQDFLERLGSFFRAEFLEEAESAVDDIHRPHRDTQFRHAGDKRANAGSPQHDGHKMREVGQEFEDERLAFDFLENVGSVRAQAPGGFVLVQAFRSGAELRVQLVRR